MQVRRSEFNNLRDKIKILKTAIDRDNTSASRLRALPPSDFNLKQMGKISDKNLVRRTEIETLETRMKQLEQGT